MKRALFLLALAPLAASSLSALEYRVLELPPLAGHGASSATEAFALSNRAAGDEDGVYVAGVSGGRAVRWTVRDGSVGAPEDLGAPASAASAAYGVNDAGHVVGTAGGDAFFWNSTAHSPFALVAAPSSVHCAVAQGINNHDMVVGTCTDLKTRSSWAFGWTPGGALILYKGDHQSTRGSQAFAVNAADVIAGSAEARPAEQGTPVVQAYKWNAGALRVGALNAKAGSFGQATGYGINDRQDLVGESEGQAFVALHGSAPVSLGFQGVARGINHARTIVGEANGHAFVKPVNGQAEDLNDLLPRGSGLTLQAAYAINEKGWIVAVGTSVDGTKRGVLLIPE